MVHVASRVGFRLLLGLLVLGCASAQPTLEPTATAAPSAARAPERLAELDALDSLTVAGEVRSAHPAGDFTGSIRVNEAAKGYGRLGRGPMPPGAVILQVLAPDAGAPAVLYYAMRRREPGYFSLGGDWEYLVAGPDGLIRAGGKLPLCARCHAEAPREHLFEPRALP